jgi:hypothetical protein
MVSSTPRLYFTPGKDPVPILQEAGWDPGPVWMGGKSHPHRDSIPDCPAHSQLLYRLSYLAHNVHSSKIIYESKYTTACLQKKTQRICITHLDSDKSILRILIHSHIHDRMRESSGIQQMSNWGVKQPPQPTLLLQSSTLLFLSPTEVRTFLTLVFWISIYSC